MVLLQLAKLVIVKAYINLSNRFGTAQRLSFAGEPLDGVCCERAKHIRAPGAFVGCGYVSKQGTPKMGFVFAFPLKPTEQDILKQTQTHMCGDVGARSSVSLQVACWGGCHFRVPVEWVLVNRFRSLAQDSYAHCFRKEPIC